MTRPAGDGGLVRIAGDAAGWVLASALVAVVVAAPPPLALTYGAVAVAAQVAIRVLRRGRYRPGSLEDVSALARAAGVVALIAAGLALPVALALGEPSAWAALALLTPAPALVVAACWRVAARLGRPRTTRTDRDGDGDSPAASAEDVLIYGAGNAGEQLLRLVQSDPDARYRAVGLIDDDPGKRNLRLLGVPVLGDRGALVAAAVDREIATVILAIGRPDRELVAALSAELAAAGIALRVLPPVAQIVHGQVRMSDVRDVEVADILGRRPISTNVEEIAGHFAGRRVLVTGAGGSIGSELARQMHLLQPASLVLVDRDESALHGVQLSIYGNGLLDTPDMVLADIRDPAALEEVFATHRPEVVFHAAALKHLPMLERYPAEGWKTNVVGTANLLELARRYDVRTFVNISTDKAANPTSTLGRTKLLAERLTAWSARETGHSYLSVRFGNVLGSRGSMLGTFLHQIGAGGPVTVTHPDVTRYFMTIPEACELVIQAAAIGRGGEVLVLDMGEPVRILDVAEMLIARSGQDVRIEFTGLRQGEKLHEDLFSAAESGQRPFHPLISHVTSDPLDPAALADLATTTTLAATTERVEPR